MILTQIDALSVNATTPINSCLCILMERSIGSAILGSLELGVKVFSKVVFHFICDTYGWIIDQNYHIWYILSGCSSLK